MRRIQFFAVAATLAATLAGMLAACGAPSVTPEPEQATDMIRVPAGTGSASRLSSSTPNTVAIAKPLNAVWVAMAGVYDSLGIPITTVDPTTHTIGNGDLQLRRRLGTTPLREYLNCGTTQGVSNTDTYDVRMSVLSKLTANPDGGTTITTTVQGMGRPITTSGDYLRCSSSGSLEIRLGEIARARAGR